MFGIFLDKGLQNQGYAKRPDTRSNREYLPDNQKIPVQ
jgi:hypothetical protein